MKHHAITGSAIAAAVLSICLPVAAQAATARSFAEMTGVSFDFGGAGYIDPGSVRKTLSVVYDDLDAAEVTLFSKSATGFETLQKSIDTGHIGATTRWQGDTISASLEVRDWPKDATVPSFDDSLFVRASSALTGDVHLAPHSSVNLSVDWRASNRSSLDKTDPIVDSAASGLRANFASPDFFFVPTVLDFYYESRPGTSDQFASRQSVVWSNDSDSWATAQFQLTAIADSRGYAPTPPIPEPSTWALMLGGLACVGRLAQRRRR